MKKFVATIAAVLAAATAAAVALPDTATPSPTSAPPRIDAVSPPVVQFMADPLQVPFPAPQMPRATPSVPVVPMPKATVEVGP